MVLLKPKCMCYNSKKWLPKSSIPKNSNLTNFNFSVYCTYSTICESMQTFCWWILIHKVHTMCTFLACGEHFLQYIWFSAQNIISPIYIKYWHDSTKLASYISIINCSQSCVLVLNIEIDTSFQLKCSTSYWCFPPHTGVSSYTGFIT